MGSEAYARPSTLSSLRAVTSLDRGSLGRKLAGQFARLEDAAFGDDGGKERCCTATKGDEFASDSSPFQYYFLSGSQLKGVAWSWSAIRRRSGVPIETLPGRKAETD